MLKRIVRHSPKIVEFVAILQLAFTKPQYRHVLNVVDALIVSEQPQKTLSQLCKLVLDAPDASNAADCYRISPWEAQTIEEGIRQFAVAQLVERAKASGDHKLFVKLDDSLTKKDAQTKQIEGVSFHYDHNASTRKTARYANGMVHVEVSLELDGVCYFYGFGLYLTQKTVRRLNRRRRKNGKQRIAFKTKYKLARAMLADLKARLPQWLEVIVLFDSWYASNNLLKFCRRQGWHVICAIKSNRLLNGVKLSIWNQRLKHQRYTRVHPSATDHRKQPYLVRALSGRLKNVSFDVCVLISKRHRGDKRPKYFLCTDLSLSAQTILDFYRKRWPIEVENFYIKQFLGLGDFRLRSFAAVQKWFATVYLALQYLQWRFNQRQLDPAQSQRITSLPDVIRLHRYEHDKLLLTAACSMAIEVGSVEPVLARFAPT
jgi:hypothetical protein